LGLFTEKTLIMLLASCLLSSCESENNIDVTPSSIVPVSNDADWWQQRHESIVTADKSKAKILFIGDSITHNWEKEPYGKAIWQQYFGNGYGFNLGFDSDKTQNVLWRLENGELNGASPDFIVLMIGTNNAKDYSAEQISEGVVAIVDLLRSSLPNAKILLYRIFPRGKKTDPLRKTINKASDIFSRKADNKNIFYLDINQYFEDILGNVPPDIMPDGLHPSTTGYVIWANTLTQKMSELNLN